MLVVHRDARGRAGDRGHRAGPGRRARSEAARGAGAPRDLPGRATGRSWRCPNVEVDLADLYAAVHASYPDEPPLRGRQHVDPRAGRRAAAGPAPDRRDDAAGALAHALDELGPGRARRGPRWPSASRTTPTSPSTASGRGPAEDEANVALGDRADAGDGAARQRHPARRREPRPAAGALRQRREPGAPRRAAGRRTTPTASSTRGWGGSERGDERARRSAEYLGAAADAARRRRCWRRSQRGPIDPADALPPPRPRPPARPGAAAGRDRLVHAARRRRLRRGAHADARRSAPRWSTGGSTGTRATRCATGSGTRRPTSTTRLEPPRRRAGAKAHWGAVHHPVEDVGTGTVHARIAFLRADRARLLDRRPRRSRASATIVCGLVGDDRRRDAPLADGPRLPRATATALVLRSHFWLGAAIRPYLPAPLAAPLGGGAQQPRRAAAWRCRRTCRGRSRPTAPRSTRTWRPCCPSCTAVRKLRA